MNYTAHVNILLNFKNEVMEYFINDGTETIGPFTKEELKIKGIKSDMLIYTDETDWQEAKKIPELVDILRKIPPPPPTRPLKVESFVAEPEPTRVHKSVPVNQQPYYNITTPEPKKSRIGLYVLIVGLGLCGGGVILNQQEQNQRLENSIRSEALTKQREETEKEKQNFRDELSSLRTEYEVQRDKLSRVEQFELLRSQERREEEIREVNTVLRSIEERMESVKKRLQMLGN
jgi:hypothetical protein